MSRTGEPTREGGAGGGDEPQLGELLVQHLAHVRAFLRVRLGADFRARESVSDLVQSVCREILAHADRFSYQGERQFRSWLCQAALQRLGDARREHLGPARDVRREQRDGEDVRVSALVTAGMPGPSTAAMQRELQARVEQVFDLLAPQQRDVLARRRILGMSHAEIAGELGISEANCRQVSSRAMAAFAAKWEDLGFGGA